MTEDLVSDKQISQGAQRRFTILIAATILIALFLVGVALDLYETSGAAQLDLSRPGYVSVRKQAVQSDQFNGFSSNGTIDKAAVDQFRQLYVSQATKATSVDSFSGDPMSDQALSIDNPPTN
jgi:hypothetical protein